MACDAQSLITLAIGNGYAKLSERDLLACILAAACAGGSSSGAGGNGAIYAGTLAQRNATTPTVTGAIWVTTDQNFTMYFWTGAAWQ